MTLLLAKKMKSFTDGEEILKHALEIAVMKKIQHKLNTDKYAPKVEDLHTVFQSRFREFATEENNITPPVLSYFQKNASPCLLHIFS